MLDQDDSRQPIIARQGKIIRRHDATCYIEAETRLSDAKAKAAAMIRAAEANIAEQGRLGYEKGCEDGRAEQALMVAEAIAKRDAYLANAEAEVCSLLLASIRTVFDGFDDIDKTRMVVEKALLALRTHTQALIRVHPSQYDSVRQHVAEIASRLPGLQSFEVKPDGTIAEAACIVSSEMGTIETSIAAQIASLETAIVNAMGHLPRAERAPAVLAQDDLDLTALASSLEHQELR